MTTKPKPSPWLKLIQRICATHKLTSITLAKLMRVSNNTVTNWTSGRSTPNRFDGPVLEALAEAEENPRMIRRFINVKRNAKTNRAACAHLLFTLFAGRK